MLALIIILAILAVIELIFSIRQKSEHWQRKIEVDKLKNKSGDKAEEETISNKKINQKKDLEHENLVVNTASAPTKIISPPLPQTIELTDEMKAAEEAVLHDERYQIVWIYGAAGTGKTTFLNIIKRKEKRKFVVLAPTGAAAELIDGMTIHRFFHIDVQNIYRGRDYGFLETKKYRHSLDLWNQLDLIIIDEISMVRSDLLDEIDRRMQHAKDLKVPFGGTKMLFLGDPYQLPPVLEDPDKADFYEQYKTPYFFSSKAYKELLVTGKIKHIEFTKIFRQNDEKFLSVLNNCRLCHFSDQDLMYLNARVRQQFDNQILKITTTRNQSENINQREYDRLSGPEYIFEAELKIIINNVKPPAEWPAAQTLKLKEGTHILLLVNENGYVNGTTAVIKAINENSIIAYNDKKEYTITRHTWEDKIYVFFDNHIILETAYSYTQFPIAYGWAMTIHKAQGKTVNAISVSFGNGAFAPGQAYVALSRVKTIDGLFLTTKVRKNDFLECKDVTKYFEYIKNMNL